MSLVAVVTIAGSTVTSRTRLAGMRASQVYGSPTSCTFRMDGSAPTAGQELKIGLGDTTTPNLLFAGVITRVTQAYEGRLANIAWDVEARDYTWLLNRLMPCKGYAPISATTIAQDLISSFTSGFTSTNVQASLAAVVPTPSPYGLIAPYGIAFDGTVDFSTCLTSLATAIGGYWYIDYAKDLHFFTAEATGSPDTLDGTGTKLQLDPPLSVDADLSQIRTRVYVEGAGAGVIANLPVSATLVPLDSVVIFKQGGGTARIGPQRITYTGVSGDVPVATPTGTWTLTANSGLGGSLPQNTGFSYKITWLTPSVMGGNGESLASAASTILTTPNSGGSTWDVNVVFTPTIGTAPPNLSGFQLYRSLVSSNGTGPWKRFNFSTAGNASIMASLAGGGVSLDDTTQGTETIDPPTTSTAFDTSTMGSTTVGSTTIGGSVTVAERGHFSHTGGAAVVTVNGRPFVVTYTGTTVAYGQGVLTGTPSTGFGSVLETIPASTQIQNAACLTGVSGVLYPIRVGDQASLYVTRNDSAAQTALAALEGGDGIHEHTISDSSLISDDMANARGDADLTLFKSTIQTLRYVTRDLKTRVGKTVTVSLGAPTSISGTFKILRVTIDQIDLCAGALAPRFTVEASSSKFTIEDLFRHVALRNP